jgi:dephospho-CoA kinase
MLKVGITGGIGSGKTVVCQVFETLGIPVFYADREARYLMENDALLIDAIKILFGDDIFVAGKPDREKIASIVFRDDSTLQQLNAIVHPAVLRYSHQWMQNRTGQYAIKEAAIFFESGSYKEMDVMIGIYAPVKLRIIRTQQRDQVSQEKILERMSHQMDEDEKMKRCDYVITNDGNTALIPQVLQIHQALLERTGAT